MANEKPAIVVVHGAWHVPAHYDFFADQLRGAGYEVSVPHLPSCGERAASSTIDDDIKVVRECIKGLVDSSRDVILIAHSYGGAVATQALAGDDLIYQQRKAAGLLGGVLHLTYMCAFMLQPGESCFSVSQPRPDPDPVEPGNDGTSFLCLPGRELFYDDVETGLAAESEKLLVRHSLAALAGTISYPAWKYLPTMYLMCMKDKVLFPEWQARQIEAVKAEGIRPEVREYEASHSPFLSMPEKMVEVVQDVAARY